jgi:hypothetical protein
MDEETKPPARPAKKAEPPPPAAPAPIRRTPAEWADKLGLIQYANPKLPQQRTTALWQHAVANELWGWERHAYNFQVERFELTEEQYRKALAAAALYPCCDVPKDVIPPSELDRFKNFVPRASRKPQKERN